MTSNDVGLCLDDGDSLSNFESIQLRDSRDETRRNPFLPSFFGDNDRLEAV